MTNKIDVYDENSNDVSYSMTKAINHFIMPILFNDQRIKYTVYEYEGKDENIDMHNDDFVLMPREYLNIKRYKSETDSFAPLSDVEQTLYEKGMKLLKREFDYIDKKQKLLEKMEKLEEKHEQLLEEVEKLKEEAREKL